MHPAPGNPDRTLVNALLAHCGNQLTGIGGVQRPGIVHRLDKDTSGLMVAAKTQPAHASLTEQFAARLISRRYAALVWGTPLPGAGRIAGNIGRNPRQRRKMAVLARGGKPAVTQYAVRRRLGPADSPVMSLVDCCLETGRTHQIRVHMMHIGHPIVGDTLYGRRRTVPSFPRHEAVSHGLRALGRQALHAAHLAFDHPTRPDRLVFGSKLPNDMKTVIQSFE